MNALTFVEYTKTTKDAETTSANGRIIRNAAMAAQSEWLETVELTEEDREMLFGMDSNEDMVFEYQSDAVDAIWTQYQLEEDQTALSGLREYVNYNVRDDGAHRPLAIDMAYKDGCAHVYAWKRHKKAIQLQKTHARRLKSRQYHDISDIVLGKDGTLLGSTRAQREHKAAKADAFKDATSALKNAHRQKVRRYMATNGVDVFTAMAALRATGKL